MALRPSAPAASPIGKGKAGAALDAALRPTSALSSPGIYRLRMDARDNPAVEHGYFLACFRSAEWAGANGRNRSISANMSSPAGQSAVTGKDEFMDKALYDKGMAMRRKVLGDEYVDRAVANTDDFNRKFQDLLNEFCWGAVWTDEDLKPRDRSLLNLGMIACLGRMHEFEAHFRGALRNGLTPKELSAVLRQIAIYCGFPAAVDAHRVAKHVLTSANKG
jgi:4-carboxymuconolactone decarboxylase